MAEMALRNVCKQFDSAHYGVKNFNLDIHDKEFVIFVGPSGCGKSTTLRLIAGLEEITDGELWIDGKLCNYLEPRERDMSMVFQNYALYPNMTVYENISYSLKIRKVPKKEIDKRVKEIAKILEIEPLLKRKPVALSGGQKQRVAIGAAIIRKPKAFLMDEPLSNLDAKLRAQMRVELKKIHNQLDTTIIYVTHDQTEAMTLGTKIVVMKDGEIQQVDTPQNIYSNPINKFVAAMIFQIMLHPTVGIVNKLLGLDINWLNDPRTALYCVAILTAWLNSGINFLYFSAGLGNIDETIYERASVDGASGVQQFFHLTLPGLSPIMFYTVVVNIIQAFQSFGQIKILTEGGPNESTNVIVYSIYRDAFFNYRFGSASAQSVILFIIIMLITLVMFRMERKGVNY